MAFTVIYDACVLFPAPLRDLLIRLGYAGLVHARWTEQILDECFASLKARRPDLTEASLQRTRTLMNAAVRDSLVTGYEPLIEGLRLPDADDRHVLAAAIRAGAQVIVTSNLKDFPANGLLPFGIEARSPDDFVLQLLELAPGASA
jgi:predicted nucleic acid-binding protein